MTIVFRQTIFRERISPVLAVIIGVLYEYILSKQLMGFTALLFIMETFILYVHF